MSLRRAVLGLLVAGVATVGAGYVLAFFLEGAGRGGAALVVTGTALALAAAMALGALRDGRLESVAPVLGFVLLLVGGGLGALLLIPPTDPADPTLFLGLPPGAALLLYGVGLLPVLVVPLAYALTFDRAHLSPEDLERVRRVAGADGRDVGADGTGGGGHGVDAPEPRTGREGEAG